jgi:hypothetical protein
MTSQRRPVRLCWYDGIQEDERSLLTHVRAGKEVWLEGDNPAYESDFKIRQRNWLARIPTLGPRWGFPVLTLVPTDTATFRNRAIVRSRTPWNTGVDMPDPMGRITGQASYIFEDDFGHRSGLLNVTGLGDIAIRGIKTTDRSGRIGAELPIPEPFPEIGIGLSSQGKGTIEFTGIIVTPTDPLIELELITPWGRNDNNLNQYLMNYAQALYDRRFILLPDYQEFVRASQPSFNPWLPASEPEVRISIPETRLSVSPAEPHFFEVSISFQQATQFVFALRARDIDHPGLYVLSDLLAVYAVD